MNIHKLEHAISEAKRFINAADQAVDEIKEYRKSQYCKNTNETPSPSRKASATRRASLDLSVALADLRKYESRW